MDTLATVAAMQERAEAERRAGRTIAFVPTMGYLHEGHLSLVREARRRADVVVASIFVNKMQFNDAGDFDGYPRTLERDAALLEAEGVDVLYAPDHDAMYPEGFCTRVEVDGLTDGLCGAFRPGHFRGVTTVVAKLFHAVRPHVAIFGEKDYQQLVTIRAMARDLDLGVDVVGMPIVREADGLAMSSRNVHLSPDERARALGLSRSLEAAREAVEAGERDVGALLGLVRRTLAESLGEGPDGRVEYVELVGADRLEPLATLDRPAVLALGVQVGSTRLIDNATLSP